MNTSSKNNKRIDSAQKSLIYNSVTEFYKNQSNFGRSSNKLDLHLTELAKNLELDKIDVEQIAQNITLKHDQQPSFNDRFSSGVVKNSKRIIVSIVIITVASLLLLNRSALL